MAEVRFQERFESVRSVLPKFGLTELKKEQKWVLFHLISEKDVFVNLPDSFGKQVVYQLAPLILEEMGWLDGKIRSAIVLVVSLLVSLMKDQVKHLQQKGGKASFIGGGQEEGNLQKI